MKSYILLTKLFFISFLFSSCLSSCETSEDTDNVSLTATISVSESPKGDNYVLLSNASQGVYSLAEWDFGNGQTANNIEEVEMYYPMKGEYTVTLDVWENGVHSQDTKVVTIESDDVAVQFEVVEDDSSPYKYTVTNTSEDLTSDYTWVISGVGEFENLETISFYHGMKGDCVIQLSTIIDGQEVTVTETITNSVIDPSYWDLVELAWSDEFDGSSVDENNWTFETGDNGWGNNEWQNYTDGDNSTLKDGILQIVAKKVGTGQQVGDYTSSRMISKGKQTFTYGRIEFRAKLPADKGNGIWPALWMLGEDISTVGWPACGEIDIMEYVSFQPNTVHSAIHNTSSSGNTVNTSGDINLETCEEEYHNYGILWTSESIQFYIDTPENIIYTYEPSVKNDETWPFDKPQFLLMNIAIGGNWGGAQGVDDTIFPTSMDVDYVRVYQHNTHLK